MPSLLHLPLLLEILVAKINMNKPLCDQVVFHSPKAYFAILNRILLVGGLGDYHDYNCDHRIRKLLVSRKDIEKGNRVEERISRIEERTSCVEAITWAQRSTTITNASHHHRECKPYTL
ncbi:hypothetical protein EV368DRAFT_68286 [Lentinula lateritia]|nr:hypothetical protein EV368DRAFT_68286 [Lentinula lateritia]